MKNILLFAIVLMHPLADVTQINIESIAKVIMYLTASTQKKLDLNWEHCAFVKVANGLEEMKKEDHNVYVQCRSIVVETIGKCMVSVHRWTNVCQCECGNAERPFNASHWSLPRAS